MTDDDKNRKDGKKDGKDCKDDHTTLAGTPTTITKPNDAHLYHQM